MLDDPSDLVQEAANALSNAIRTAFIVGVNDVWKQYKCRCPTVRQMLEDTDVLRGYPLRPRIAVFLIRVQKAFNDLLRLAQPQQASEIAWARAREAFPFDAFQVSQLHIERFPVGDNGRKFSKWVAKGFKRYLPKDANERGLFARAVWRLLVPFREETEQIFSRSTTLETEKTTNLATAPRTKRQTAKPLGRPRSKPHIDPELAKRRAIVKENRDTSARELCEIFDRQNVPLPTKWQAAGLSNWSEAYKDHRLHPRIDVLISKERTSN